MATRITTIYLGLDIGKYRAKCFTGITSNFHCISSNEALVTVLHTWLRES